MTDLHQAHTRFCQEQEIFRRLSPKTVTWHRDSFKSLTRLDENLTLRDINEAILRDWFRLGYQKGWTPKTIISRMDALNFFFEWLIREKLLIENPMKKMPRPQLPKPIPKHLSKQEAEHLIRFTRNFPFLYEFERARAIAILAMFLGTGLRREELRKLENRDVDFENRRIFVRDGKGAKDRYVPMPLSLIPTLQDYQRHRQRLKRTTPYFWSSLTNDQIICEKTIPRLIVKIRKASGIPFSPHKLRHTFAVLMLESGCDIYALSKMMGHSDIKTTTIYLRATTAHMQEQMRGYPLNF